jgi:hypothetical protein
LRREKKGARLTVAVISVVTISCVGVARSSSLEELQLSCAQKTIVVGRDGARIGEKLNGYCIGFLEGAFALMEQANLICPESQNNGEFLLSVLNTYVADKQIKGVAAGEAVEAAYRRAFPCKR